MCPDIRPDTGLGGLQTLRDAVIPFGGFFDIVKSDRDGALLTSGADKPNSVIQGNINNNGQGKPGILSGARLIPTAQRGLPIKGLYNHGVQDYLRWLKNNGKCK